MHFVVLTEVMELNLRDMSLYEILLLAVFCCKMELSQAKSFFFPIRLKVLNYTSANKKMNKPYLTIRSNVDFARNDCNFG